MADKLSLCAAYVPPAKPIFALSDETHYYSSRNESVNGCVHCDTKHRAQKHELSHCNRIAEVATNFWVNAKTAINYFNVNVDGRKERNEGENDWMQRSECKRREYSPTVTNLSRILALGQCSNSAVHIIGKRFPAYRIVQLSAMHELHSSANAASEVNANKWNTYDWAKWSCVVQEVLQEPHGKRIRLKLENSTQSNFNS